MWYMYGIKWMNKVKIEWIERQVSVIEGRKSLNWSRRKRDFWTWEGDEESICSGLHIEFIIESSVWVGEKYTKSEDEDNKKEPNKYAKHNKIPNVHTKTERTRVIVAYMGNDDII